MSHGIYAYAIAPDLELFSGGSPERVGSCEHYGLALPAEHVAELGYRGRLSSAVDAYHQYYEGTLVGQSAPAALVRNHSYYIYERILYSLRLRYMVYFDVVAQILHDPHRSFHAYVAGYEYLLELIEKLATQIGRASCRERV